MDKTHITIWVHVHYVSEERWKVEMKKSEMIFFLFASMQRIYSRGKRRDGKILYALGGKKGAMASQDDGISRSF